MAIPKLIDEKAQTLLSLLNKNQRWLIVINADPDSMGSALALKAILSRKVLDIGIGHVNEINRPDNLAMIRYLRVPTRRLIPNLIAQYDRFALVDSQPHHHPELEKLDYSVVIDHHPLLPDKPVSAPLTDIRPKYGATCTMLTEYLQRLEIRPPKLLASAMLYGIKADTLNFQRKFIDADINAFKYLSKYADHTLIQRIARSEYHLEWMRYFSRAFYNLRRIGSGLTAHLGKVQSPDILVVVADFFMRVHSISWDAVSGVFGDTLVVIFRGDGLRKDMGKFAASHFGELGSAGGHKGAARAEVPMEALDGKDPEMFVLKKLSRGKTASFQRI
ncbi:MAG: phosphoesterase [Deltaproteobacteria bacterium HGW-Deltaproteobacteria-8]|jgi:nanoRNase/pAp phosphatase (c-di-AMP/oligoRNAs hydrolase)|nr:MAG: phosphoesterase [Deltaproteobacteria bacterium HGW-Deltaproteobacteria-8]